MKTITIEELDELLTVACKDRDAYAADLSAAKAEVDRLRAELAEAQATLANERGEGDPPEPGWSRNDFDRGVISWTLYLDERLRPLEIPNGVDERWVLWAILDRAKGEIGWNVDECEEGRTIKAGPAVSLRAAMRAAIAALPSLSGSP